MTEPTIVYTDGACKGNPGPGGWAWAIPDGAFASGADPDTTNQRMELVAALEAVKAIDGPIEVISDSTYVVNCFRDRWWEGWLKRGWVNSKKEPVANRDLWEPLINEVRSRPIKFRWVKGHSNDPWNDLVDGLAVEAAAAGTGRSGSEPPRDVEQSDSPRPARTKGLPDGHLIAVFGIRPPQLGGYQENPISEQVRERLQYVISAKAEMYPDLHVVTGMGLGAETLGAEAARAANVPYVAVLAYPEFEGMWPAESRRKFADLVAQAATTITLEKKTPENRQKAGAAQSRRDGWLRSNINEAIVVWDGSDGSIARLARSLEKDLGEENLWLINSGEI